MATVYIVNKHINKSIEFRGIKAQYLMYLAIGLVVLLLLFAVSYIIGVNIYVCMILVISLGTSLFMFVKRYSDKYGEHGLTRKVAQAKLPEFITSSSRIIFYQLLSEVENEEQKTGRRLSNKQN